MIRFFQLSNLDYIICFNHNYYYVKRDDTIDEMSNKIDAGSRTHNPVEHSCS